MRSRLIGLGRLARDVRDGDDAFHRAGMRQLRVAQRQCRRWRKCPGSAVRMYSSIFTKPRSSSIFVFSMPTFSVRGARPTATSTFSASSFCCLPSTVKVTATPPLVLSTFSTLAFTKPLMPRLRYTRISSFDTSSSSTGT